MHTPTTGERDAAVTPDVMIMTRRPESESSPSIDGQPPEDETTERLLDAIGLLALERVENMETKQQHRDLLLSADTDGVG